MVVGLGARSTRQMADEVEVEAVQVLKKSLKLRTVSVGSREQAALNEDSVGRLARGFLSLGASCGLQFH